MKCSRWHQLIALDVGGELRGRPARRVERHLDTCPACRKLAQALKSDLEVLSGLESDELNGMAFGSVRGEVMAEIEKRHAFPMAAVFSGHNRVAVAAAAVALLAALIVMWPGAGPDEPRIVEESVRKTTDAADPLVEAGSEEPDFLAATVHEPLEQQLPDLDREPRTVVARAESPSVALPAAVSPSALVEPMTMKILTDDPDVVIYWIVDSKGEKEHA
jgi:anti-sigma factor RsiW